MLSFQLLKEGLHAYNSALEYRVDALVSRLLGRIATENVY
jgi:hypothetical protein